MTIFLMSGLGLGTRVAILSIEDFCFEGWGIHYKLNNTASFENVKALQSVSTANF